MNSPTRIVIGGEDDQHIEYVERYLDEPFLILNARGILKGDKYSYSLLDGSTKITRNNHPLKNVDSVWFRRLMLVRGFELPVSEDKQKYCQDAIRYFNNLIFAQFADALWVSDFYATEKADDKFWQLQVASRVGFNVPDTLFTSSPQKAAEFTRAHKSVIAKPNYSARFHQDGKDYVFYASRVNRKTDFSGIRVAPAILQEAIEVKTELRITVVGNKVFAAVVDSDTSHAGEHIRDWRVASLSDQATYEAFDLPRKEADKCVVLVKELGLKFGAIDAIIDPHDKLWFLENNTVGQWAFIEDATGLPIAKAMAMLLMEGQ